MLDRLAAAVDSVDGVTLLDRHADADHHRSVFTLVGSPAAVSEAAFRAVAAACDQIDLSRHEGVHPRIGAADVVPFVPLAGSTMDDAVQCARSLGRRVGDELGIPVFLYGRAAPDPARATPADLRRGGLETLAGRLATETVSPDFGPAALHPSAGATAVGARPSLVAYNLMLTTADVALARRVARGIRESSGGLPAVQAMGFGVRGSAQVSTNLLDIERTPLRAVFDRVAALAAAEGAAISHTEIVGLVPARAVSGLTGADLRLEDELEDHLLERRMETMRAPPARRD